MDPRVLRNRVRGTLLLVGRVADLVGARRIFIAGVVVFGATSLLAGLAPNGGLLILARFLQGAGAAMILPTSLSLLNAMFTGKARGQAFAVWGSTSALHPPSAHCSAAGLPNMPHGVGHSGSTFRLLRSF